MRAVHVALTAGGLVVAVVSALALWWFSPSPSVGHVTPSAAASAQPPPPRSVRVPPLLGADGTPQPALPHAVPTDTRERTLAALYATRAQAQALDAALDGAVLWVEVDCCATPLPALALDLADGEHGGHPIALDTPLFVVGPSLQRAALVANRLTEAGFLQVFLVTR